MRILFISWLFFILLFGSNILLISGQCLNDQQSLLLQLKKNLKFNSSLSTKLVQWNQSSGYCQWDGVTCNNVRCVIGLDLNNESISGGFNNSSSLFSLQFLQRLNLAFNSFNFTQIPNGFGKLTSLTYLNLSNAGFAGQIPTEFSSMTRLVTLDLSTLLFPGIRPLKLENPNLSMFVQNLPELTELRLDGVNISTRGTEWCQTISSSLPNLRILGLMNCNLSGPIDRSLLKLQSLSVIRLAQNDLSAPVPEFFANFTNLTVLLLSSCNLNGTFPGKIFQVPTLQTLDLSNNRLLQGSLPNFTQNGDLQTLVLSNTNFSGSLPDSIGNLGRLSRIELNNCNFSGSIPNSIATLSQLVYLDFSTNNFTGSIPSFSLSKNLTQINLSHNGLTGEIPSSHWQGLQDLVGLDLRYNSLKGSIPMSLFSLPSLRRIQLSNNQFDGLAGEFSNASSPVDTLDLSSNNLQGRIPMSFFNLQRLNILMLSYNNFSGTLQIEMIQRLPNLTTLDLSYNTLSIDASGSNSSLSSFPHITTLKLASCKLQKFPDLSNQSRLVHLDLSDNQIYGEVPNWIWKVGNRELFHLNLSCNFLVDLQVPYIIPSLSVLDLHSNQLRGKIPIPPLAAIYVDYSSNNFNSSIPSDIGTFIAFASFFSLSNNSLTGIIPQSICNASYLQVLDLSNNALSGTIPQCLIEMSKTLGVLNLGRNSLSGIIPNAFPANCGLKTLDFNGNVLEGQIPPSLENCRILEVLNVGNNKMNGAFPCWLKNSSSLRVLVLRSNQFFGKIHCHQANRSWTNLQIMDLAHNNFDGDLPPKCFLKWRAMMVDEEDDAQSKLNHLRFEFLQLSHFYYQDTVTVTNKGLEMKLVKILTVFTSIDFSCNRFQGKIPDTVGNLKSLYVLNLSHNAFTGSIPASIGNLKQLGSLDLSMNMLSGEVPMQLAGLTFLSVLNVSYNQLVGMIPPGPQFQTFSETSFEGNKGLCGPPLSKDCSIPSSPPTSQDSGSILHWQFIFTGLGFGLGAGIVVGPFMFWKQGRNWSDEHMDKFLSMVLLRLGFIYTCCYFGKVAAEETIEKDPMDDSGISDDDEDEREDRAFQGRYCVFCSKLDIRRKKAIHNPKCTCYDSPPISSSSSCSCSSSS